MAPADVLPAIDHFAAAVPPVYNDYYSAGLRARYNIDAERAAVKAASHPTAPPNEPYATIGYDVDEAAFRRRAAARVAAGGLPTAIPHGWPTKLAGPLVWSKPDVDEESKYMHVLSDQDKVEIQSALNAFKGECRVAFLSNPPPQAGTPG